MADHAVELAAKRAAGWNPLVVDVREPHEARDRPHPGQRANSCRRDPARMNELDSSRDIVLYCRSGVHSARALEQLRTAGFTKLKNLTGGILAWSDDVDSSIPKY